jgi:hypothetical protein
MVQIYFGKNQIRHPQKHAPYWAHLAVCFCWFPSSLAAPPWRWRRYVPPKSWAFSKLYGVATQKTLLVKPLVAKLPKNFLKCYGTRVSLSCSQQSSLFPIRSQINPFHTILYYFSNIQFRSLASNILGSGQPRSGDPAWGFDVGLSSAHRKKKQVYCEMICGLQIWSDSLELRKERKMDIRFGTQNTVAFVNWFELSSVASSTVLFGVR